jgi:hypothetical protein
VGTTAFELKELNRNPIPKIEIINNNPKKKAVIVFTESSFRN